MQDLKNIFVGFLVSFIGSIPLGYLNVVGFELYRRQGFNAACIYLLGVILIEFFVIYLTLVFVHKLAENKRLTKYIEGFSVLFMIALAVVFYVGSNSKTDYSTALDYPPFVLGIVLSGLNFVQLPFWTGWNLYLLNGNYIEVSGMRKFLYVFGTLAGTFSGMLALILSLHYFADNVAFLSKYLMKYIIPLVFLGLGIFQGIQFFRKYSH